MKYCDKCGAQIPEGSLACPACQTPVTVLPVTNVQPTYAPDQNPVAPVEQLTPVSPDVTPVQPASVAPVQPAVAPVQPNYTQPVAPVPPAQPKQKSAGIPVVVAIILLVIVAISGLLLGRVFFGSADCKEKKCDIVTNVDNDDELENPQHNVEAPNEDEEEDEPTQVGASKEAYVSGHKFTIPSKYLYEVDNEEILYVYDESTEWIAEMTLTQYLYSTISSNIETIVSNFTSSGFTVEGYEEKTIAGMTLIEIKVVDSSGVKILAAYTKVSDAYVGVITVYNQTSGKYETEKFEEVIEIMAGAKKTTSSRDNASSKSNAIVNLLPAA
ncbi:MAG: hypothetical protein ACI4OP_06915 [Candidatus Coprovivens sp.]